MNTFFVQENSEGTYHIECCIVIYRELFRCHPDFLQAYAGDARIGFNTKFYLLIEDDLPKSKAVAESKRLNETYAALIANCEESGDWSTFPFKNKAVIYYK